MLRWANLIKKRYNGKDFNFNSINSVSAGKRDPNAKAQVEVFKVLSCVNSQRLET